MGGQTLHAKLAVFSSFPSRNGFFRYSSVNLQAYWRGVTVYAYAQALWKLNYCQPVFLDDN